MNELAPIVGHEDVRRSVGDAITAGELPASLLIHGNAGVGKQRLALWIAQRIVCERSTSAEPCPSSGRETRAKVTVPHGTAPQHKFPRNFPVCSNDCAA